MATRDTELLIVGAGPVGLTCSLLASRLGIANRVVERNEGLHLAPQAHVVSARSLEIFRAAGVDAGELRAASTPPADIAAILWMQTLAGPELGRLSLATKERVSRTLAATPTPQANISQHRLEPILCVAAERAGEPVSFSHQWRGAEQDRQGVVSKVVDRVTGQEHEVRSDYVLGCDGAASAVRRALDIAMEGPAQIQSFITFFIQADLRALVRERPGLLYWNIDPEAPGVFIAHEIDSTWIYMHTYDPERESLESFTPAVGRAIVERALGAAVDFEIASIDSWTMTAQIAKHYQRDRIFLVGDAAHRFPPTGGVGMNTGIADANNLLWKIAAVHAGRAGEGLLESYGLERRGVAQANSDWSFANFREMGEVIAALDIAGLPAGAARQRLRTLGDDPERQARVQAAIDKQNDHFDMLGLDLGAAYEQGALVPDGSPVPENPNPISNPVPSTRPGARLPHVWLEREGERVSSLDLVDPHELILLTGPGGAAWGELGLAQVAIGPGCPVTDAEGQWSAVCGIGESGALLVRPDGHVAWRAPVLPEDPVGALKSALDGVLWPSFPQ